MSKLIDLTGQKFRYWTVIKRDIDKLKETHPKQYDYIINTLGMGKVLDFINVKY